MKTSIFSIFLLLISLVPSSGAELWVNQAAAPGGDGSKDAPFTSIGPAFKAARPGDTITIRQGTYREVLNLTLSGTAEKPTVVRAALGERVILSGFVPIHDWKLVGDGIYSATITGPISDLYVGLKPQPVSRWPDQDQPMRHVASSDAQANSFQDAEPLPEEPFFKAVSAEPKSAKAFLYIAQGNYYTTVSLAGLKTETRTITMGSTQKAAGIRGKSGRNQDRYQLSNHPSLIRKPGQWAFETLPDKQTRLYFRPADPADLKSTQYRQAPAPVLNIGRHGDTVSHVHIEGLEICGSTRNGIQIERASNITVSRCLLHNNAGLGVWVRRCNNIRVKNNFSTANGTGISIVSTRDAVVEGNEVALNMVDGVVVAGNVSGRPDGEPESADVTVRRNYIHHHLLLSHPDNIQAYRGVKNLNIEENVFLFGGQAIMTEEVDGARLRDCVAVGTAAVAVIFGHGNSHRWTVENCTVGLGGWGAFSFTGQGYQLRKNIVWNNPLSLEKSVTSDHNFFFSDRENQPVCLVSKPNWRSYVNLADVAQATGQEGHSKRARPTFRNAPFCQAVGPGDDTSRADRLVLRLARNGDITDFQVGDHVEINGDGVLRRLTAVEAGAIRFEPSLPRRPFRDVLVWNWKQTKTAELDLRPVENSPALKGGADGRPVGASLDIPAFRRGDFDGDGKRDIPDLPDDLKAALPSPNDIIIPLYGA